MQTKFLTEEERSRGKSKVYWFQAFNGMGFNFMGETPVYLLAIHFGASNLQLGYISSVIFLTGFILFFLPQLLAGKNLVKVQTVAWTLRGAFVLLNLFLFLLDGRPAVLLILIVYTLFCGARMVGVVIWNPLIRMVTTSQNRGEVLAQGNITNQSASVLSKLISFIITSIHLFTGAAGIILLQVVGVVLNSFAALQLKKVPCRETVEYKKGRNLFSILKESMKLKERRYPLLLRWCAITIMVLNGLTIVFVRKEAGFDANMVFLYTMVISLANILSGLFGKTFSDRLGSRPLLIGMNIFLSLSFIIWIFLPMAGSQPLPVYLYFILGFFTNLFLLGAHVLIARVVVNTMPEEESFSYNSMINFITALFSLFTGIVGGILIDRGELLRQVIPNSFSLLFAFALLISLIQIVFSLRLIDKGSLSPREAVAILFSLEGLRAYSFIGKFNSTDDPIKKRTVLMSISQSDAPLATEELRTILASPLSSGKGEVLKSLFSHPREELLDEILQEAQDSGSYHQLNAIFALGAYENSKVETILLMLLDSNDSQVRSNAAKSLGRMGHKSSLNRIRSLFQDATTPWDKINYLIALKNMDSKGEIFRKTFQIPQGINEGRFHQTYYSLTADLLDMKPKLSDIYAAKNLRKGFGLKEFLEQTRDQEFFYNEHKKLIQWFQKEEWDSIGRFCKQSIEMGKSISPLSEPYQELRKSLAHEAQELGSSTNREEAFLYDDALALVYFTYQIL